MAFVQVRNADRPEKARELLDAAEKAGLSATVVRTVDGGYDVPDELVEPKPAKRSPSKRQGSDD